MHSLLKKGIFFIIIKENLKEFCVAIIDLNRNKKGIRHRKYEKLVKEISSFYKL